MLNPIDRIYFWCTIMRDHSEFILFSLSSRELDVVKEAENFKNTWMNFEKELESMMNTRIATSSEAFINNIYSTLNNFIEFKKYILKQLLTCNIEISLSPTFINHMINEAMEFLRELELISNNTILNPINEMITFHKLWLPDASGHAGSLISDLDLTEAELIKESKMFEDMFNELHIKVLELEKMIDRTKLNESLLIYFNEQVKEKINAFVAFLERLKDSRIKRQVLGILKPLIPDHMIREEQYYLANIDYLENKRT